MRLPCTISIAHTVLGFGTFLFSVFSFHPASAQHAVSTICGTGIQGNPIAGPNGACLDPTGNWLFLADYTAHQVKRINTTTGSLTVFAGTGTSGYTDGSKSGAAFSYPTGICISGDGLSLYICDNNNCLVRRIDLASGTVSTAAGVYNAFAFGDSSDGMQAKFNQPYDIVMAHDDSAVYISDSENHVIRKLVIATGAVSTIAGTPGTLGNQDGAAMSARFRTPAGLALSTDGDMLYVADAGNHRIRIVDLAASTVSTMAGSIQGYADDAVGIQAQFYSPKGIALLPGDSVMYVTDTYNDRIRCIDMASTSVSTLAGGVSTPSSHFANHTNGLMAKFYRPVSCTVSADGTILFISDQENFRIRAMSTGTTVTHAMPGFEKEEFDIYPNPASSDLHLRLPAGMPQSVPYTVKNMSGSLVRSGTLLPSGTRTARIGIGDLSAGSYILGLGNGTRLYYFRFMILP